MSQRKVADWTLILRELLSDFPNLFVDVLVITDVFICWHVYQYIMTQQLVLFVPLVLT